jgi:hypothetical protein
MGNSTERRLSAYRTFSSRDSDPARLCCALTRLSQALALSVPRSELRIDYLRGVCDCRGFRTEEIGWPSEDEAS